MLSKTVCKQCINNSLDRKGRWRRWHETNWKDGVVWCGVVNRGSSWLFHGKDAPPCKCPYGLEHIVGTQKKC